MTSTNPNPMHVTFESLNMKPNNVDAHTVAFIIGEYERSAFATGYAMKHAIIASELKAIAIANSHAQPMDYSALCQVGVTGAEQLLAIGSAMPPFLTIPAVTALMAFMWTAGVNDGVATAIAHLMPPAVQ
jgi:hypothetical protein